MSAEGNFRSPRVTRRIGSAGVVMVVTAVIVGASLGVSTLFERDARPTAADPTAGFTVSPADFAVTPGQTVTITIRARSGGEPINAVQSDLTYPGSLLEYSATDLDQAWDVAGPISGGTGKLRVPVASSSVMSGDVLVARASFTAKAAGRVQIAVADSSAIVSAVTSRDLLAPPDVDQPQPASPTPPVVVPVTPPVSRTPTAPRPKIALSVTRMPISLKDAVRIGVPVKVAANRRSTVTVRLIVPAKTAKTMLKASTSKPVVIGSTATTVIPGRAKVMRVKLTPKWRIRVAKLRKPIIIQVRTSVVAVNAIGTTTLRAITLSRS